MRFSTKILVFIIIVLPIGLSAFVLLSPEAFGYLQSSRNLSRSVASGDSTMELAELENILDYSPWRGELWQRVGRLLMNQGKMIEAVDAFDRALSLEMLDPQGQLWMADALITSGSTEEARKILHELSNDGDVIFLLQAAALQKKISDTEGVLATLLRAYTLDPTNSELNYQIGIQLSAQDPDNALKYLKTAQNDPGKIFSCRVLIEMIEKTTSIAGRGERSIFIGQTLAKVDEWDAAEVAFQKATEESPMNADAWAFLGEAQQQVGKNGSPALEKAMQLNPDAELVNGLTALYFRRQGKPDAAVLFLQKALKTNPSAAVWEIEWANLLADSGELDKALEHYQKAINIDPLDWISWRALAVFCITRNYRVSTIGIQAARQALVINPDSPALLDVMGTGLMMLEDLDSAERFFLEADKLDPNQAAILIHLGQLYLAKNDKQTGFQYLRRAVEVAQESRLREMAKRLLVENGGR